MTASIELHNILAHRNLSVEVTPGRPFLVTGKNESGKSSLATAIQVLTSHETNPLHRDTASRRTYVTDGAESGIAKLVDGDTTVVWSPPATSVETLHQPVSHPAAVGLVDFIANQATRGKRRLALWESLFLPATARDLLQPIWPEDDRKQLDAVLETIERDGWEIAGRLYEEQRKEAKRRWSKITGQQGWGSAKGAKWVPDHWRPQYEGRSRSDFESDVTNARDALTSLTSEIAVSTVDIERAITAKKQLVELESKRSELRERWNALQLDLRKHNADIESLQGAISANEAEARKARTVLEETAPAQCPHCNNPLEVRGDHVIVWTAPTPQEMQGARAMIERLRDLAKTDSQALSVAQEKAKVLRQQLTEVQTEGDTVRGQILQLQKQAKLADATPTTAAAEAQVAKAENAVEEAVLAMTAWERWQNARREHENVVRLDQTANLLGPGGARQERIQQGLKKLNGIYGPLANVAGWHRLEVSDTGTMLSDNRPVALTSESAKLKAQWISQFAWAILAKSRWVVLDRADVLRDESWSGLCEMVSRLSAKFPHLYVVLCATSADAHPEDWDVLDLSAQT